MDDLRKDLEKQRKLEEKILSKVKNYFVIEAIEKLSSFGIKKDDKFSFSYHHVIEKPFITINGNRSEYKSELPYKYLQSIFNHDYEAFFTKDGIIDFIETITGQKSTQFLAEIEGKLTLPFSLQDNKVINLSNVMKKQPVNDNSTQADLVLRLFNVDNAKDSYNFDEIKAAKLVQDVLKAGLIIENIKFNENHKPYSWISDLASCALISIKGEDTEGYPCYSLNTHNQNYLVMASELFKSINSDELIPLTEFNKDRYIPKFIKARSEYNLTQGDILNVVFYDGILNFNSYYNWPDKTEYTPIAVNICNKLDIPTARSSEILKNIFGHNNSYNTFGNQMRFSDIYKYFTEGYNSDKGDEFLNNILNSLVKDKEKFKSDLIAESSLKLTIHNDNMKLLKKDLPKSYEFLNELFEFSNKIKKVTKPKK